MTIPRMWGNRLGWLISAALVVVMGGFLYLVAARAGQVTPPSGRFGDLAAPVALPAPPASVVPVMTAACDAGDLYWDAIQHVLQHESLYDDFGRVSPSQRGAPKLGEAERQGQRVEIARQKLAELPKVEAYQKVLDGAACIHMNLFARRPETIIHYRASPELAALRRISELLDQAANHQRNFGDEEQARRTFEALFSLGAKLFQERVRRDELAIGLGMMQTAAQGLANLAKRAGDRTRADQLLAFAQQSGEYYKTQIDPLWQAVFHIDPEMIRQYTGDVYALAGDPRADRMWRVEAILKVGRLKYNAARRGDQLAAMREPAKWANDPDPVVAAAARAARDLTVEDYRMMNLTQ